MGTTSLYRALIEANVSDGTTKKAVEGLISVNEAATKMDIAELEVRLIKWIVATAIAVGGAVIAAMGLIARL